MQDIISIDLDLPDSILLKLTKEADSRGILVEELIEVILIDYVESI